MAYGTLLDAVRGIHWPARRTIAGGPPGLHRSKMRGTSAEFTEYRLYRQGDDTRRLDWRLLARADRAYVRLATDRAVLPTTILVDVSPSMAFPFVGTSKWQRTKELAVALAAVARADGDPVGLALYDRRSNARHLPPRGR